jgi:hypothetical protein
LGIGILQLDRTLNQNHGGRGSLMSPAGSRTSAAASEVPLLLTAFSG